MNLSSQLILLTFSGEAKDISHQLTRPERVDGRREKQDLSTSEKVVFVQFHVIFFWFFTRTLDALLTVMQAIHSAHYLTKNIMHWHNNNIGQLIFIETFWWIIISGYVVVGRSRGWCLLSIDCFWQGLDPRC